METSQIDRVRLTVSSNGGNKLASLTKLSNATFLSNFRTLCSSLVSKAGLLFPLRHFLRDPPLNHTLLSPLRQFLIVVSYSPSKPVDIYL